MFWNGKIVGEGLEDRTETTLFQIGSKFGLNTFFQTDNLGFFIRPTLMVDWATGESKDGNTSGKGEAFEISTIGYIGYKRKFDNLIIFWDLGLGYIFNSLEVVDENGDEYYVMPIAIDMNMGVGYNF